jgi:hypothetical protein
MTPTRRWLQYSLRSFLVVLTAFAIWLGVAVNRAREQREAVKAVEAMGGVVLYDWHISQIGNAPAWEPQGPVWLRLFIGNEYFQKVEQVYLMGASAPTNDTIQKLILQCRRLRGLKAVIILRPVSEKSAAELNAQLWGCEVRLRGNR